MNASVLTPRELEVLKILWELSKATVREIRDEMGRSETDLPYTTVLSLLQAMERKGLVSHQQEGKAYRYLPCIRRDRAYRNLASEFLDRVFDGAVDEYVARALESRLPDEAELERLEQAVQKAKERLSNRSRKERKK